MRGLLLKYTTAGVRVLAAMGHPYYRCIVSSKARASSCCGTSVRPCCRNTAVISASRIAMAMPSGNLCDTVSSAAASSCRLMSAPAPWGRPLLPAMLWQLHPRPKHAVPPTSCVPASAIDSWCRAAWASSRASSFCSFSAWCLVMACICSLESLHKYLLVSAPISSRSGVCRRAR